MNNSRFPDWADVASDLVAVAAGRDTADTVIRGGSLVNVQSREILTELVCCI